MKKKSNKELLVLLPETETWIATALYTNNTYEFLDAHGVAFHSGTWEQEDGDIYISNGFYWDRLNDKRPNIKDLIAWEQLEKEILS